METRREFFLYKYLIGNFNQNGEMKKLAILILLCITFSPSVKAQNVLNGVYVKEHIPTKKVISYTYLREADVMFEKRVWRIIDLREKINFPLYYPLTPMSDRWSLFDIMRHYLEKEPGALTPYLTFDPNNLYATDGDQFKYPIRYQGANDTVYTKMVDELLNVLGPEPTDPIKVDRGGVLVDSLDINNNPVYPARDKYPIGAADIVAWELKEDWFFDKQRSVMDVRIVGISPIVNIVEEDPATKQKIVKGNKNLFWIYFPELRYITQNYFVYNRKNDAQRMSFDDLFWKRMFNSYIKKEANVFDRQITDYITGVDALLESEKIKKEMMEIEHDMWDF